MQGSSRSSPRLQILACVVKTPVSSKTAETIRRKNAAYGKIFQAPHPPDPKSKVAAIPKDALVEIEVIAALEVIPIKRGHDCIVPRGR